MARNNRTQRTARKRQTKWCAATVNGLVPDHTDAVAADAVPLCVTTTAVQDEPDVVLGWMRGQITLSRLNPGLDEQSMAVAWAIVMQRTLPGSPSQPVQVFDPFDIEDLERQDILGMGHFELPPVVIVPSNDATRTVQAATVVNIDVGVSRKLGRNTNNIFLWVASTDNVNDGPDNSFHIIGSIRSIMKFG